MDIDKSQEIFLLNLDECTVLRTEQVVWPFTSAAELLEKIETQRAAVDSIDPSYTPVASQRNEIMNRKLRWGRMLDSMLNTVAPYVASGMADEVEVYLRQQP